MLIVSAERTRASEHAFRPCAWTYIKCANKIRVVTAAWLAHRRTRVVVGGGRSAVCRRIQSRIRPENPFPRRLLSRVRGFSDSTELVTNVTR